MAPPAAVTPSRGRPALLAAAFACLALLSCATPEEKPKDEFDPRNAMWPRPPELPRYRHEFTLRSPADILRETDEDRLRRLATGAPLPTNPAFEKPALVAARKGRIYVTDSARATIATFDVPRGRVFWFGLRTPGRLVKPGGIAVDDAMNVYVADAAVRRVMVYDSLGLYQRSIGDPEELERPTGVAVNAKGDRVYIVDRATNESANHRVVVYDAEGRKLQTIGTRGEEPGQFNVPLQAAVGPDGTLYVLDSGNFRVQAFDPDGKFLRQWGGVGDALGSFARPRDLAVDGEGNVYVSDASFGNVQVFSAEGRLLLALGGSGPKDLPGRYGLAYGIAVDETQRLYIVDQLFNKVEVIRRLNEEEGKALLRKYGG